MRVPGVRLVYPPLDTRMFYWYTIPMNTTDQGRLGEAKVSAYLVEQGWYVFVDISGKCPVDLIAWKDGETKRIQVKSTSYQQYGSWTAQIKSVRPNRTGNGIKQYDNAVSDWLAVYIVPEDKVVILESSEITAKNSLAVAKVTKEK